MTNILQEKFLVISLDLMLHKNITHATLFWKVGKGLATLKTICFPKNDHSGHLAYKEGEGEKALGTITG